MTQPTALPAQSSPPATSGAGTVRDIKKETIPLKGKSFNSVKKLPNIEIAPGSIKKIFVVVAAPNVSQKVLLKALQLIKAQISIKILVVQNKSSSEIGKHVNATGKLTFDSFSDAVRLNFPFKDDQRMVYLVDGEIVRHEGNSPSLYLSNPPQGVAAISLTSLSLGHEDSYIQLAKVLKALAARFYYITSNCGVLSEAATYEGTQKLPEDFCPEDKENMKSMKMIP